MNAIDRQRLHRLGALLESVPFPIAGGSSQTASVGGFIVYAEDMRQVMNAHRKIIEGLLCEHTPHFELGVDYLDPDETLGKLEEWINDRKEHGWESPIPKLKL